MKSAIEIKQGTNNRGGSKCDGVGELISNTKLFSSRERSETVDRSPDSSEAEVELSYRASSINKCMCMLFQAEVLGRIKTKVSQNIRSSSPAELQFAS